MTRKQSGCGTFWYAKFDQLDFGNLLFKAVCRTLSAFHDALDHNYDKATLFSFIDIVLYNV